MEAAWWRATGQRTPFSQQQILDCSWGTTDNEASNMGEQQGRLGLDERQAEDVQSLRCECGSTGSGQRWCARYARPSMLHSL